MKDPCQRQEALESSPKEDGGNAKFIYLLDIEPVLLRSYPRSFELDERSNSSKTVSPLKTYKKYVKLIFISVSICIVFVFLFVSLFSYTRFSTFYHIAKKRTFIKLHHIFGI